MPATLRDEIKSFRVRLGSAFGSLVFPSESDATVPISTDVLSQWLRIAEKKAQFPKLDGSLWHAYRRSWGGRTKEPTGSGRCAGRWMVRRDDADSLLSAAGRRHHAPCNERTTQGDGAGEKSDSEGNGPPNSPPQ